MHGKSENLCIGHRICSSRARHIVLVGTRNVFCNGSAHSSPLLHSSRVQIISRKWSSNSGNIFVFSQMLHGCGAADRAAFANTQTKFCAFVSWMRCAYACYKCRQKCKGSYLRASRCTEGKKSLFQHPVMRMQRAYTFGVEAKRKI